MALEIAEVKSSVLSPPCETLKTATGGCCIVSNDGLGVAALHSIPRRSLILDFEEESDPLNAA